VYVRTVGGVPDPNQRGEMIGYADALNYYLLPNVTFGAVQKLRERNGQVFPGTQKQLNRYLKEEKIITPDANGKSTHNKAFGGGQARYLVVPRSIIDGGDADEQVEIPMEELPAEMQG